MKLMNLRLATVGAAVGLLSAACFAQGRRVLAIGPWTFADGNVTSRSMVIDTIRRIAEHQGFTVIDQDAAMKFNDYNTPGFGLHHGRPYLADLARYAAAVQVDHVIFGNASWHTRSIWVGTGPKTISTATIDLFIYNAKTNTVTYQKRGAEGRSDERESVLKDVGDVILTPLITVVSGGPATPREQRAAQIALGRAFRPWVMRRNNPR